MAATTTAAGKQLLANGFAGGVAKLSLHSASPGGSGTTAELTGGSPAYARKPCTVNASAGAISLGSSVTFDVPASTVAYLGLWDSAGTTFYGSVPLTSETFAAQGTYTLTALSGTITDV